MLGLLALPALWWLLRAIPPAPRTQPFPALRLLEGLAARRQETRRAPLWLLLLRMLAAVLLIAGLAQPVLVQNRTVRSGSGSLLVVLDNGWAAAPDWAQRITALDAVLDRAGRDGRRVLLATTAPATAGPAITGPGTAAPGATADAAGPQPASQVRAAIDALRPGPWNTDRAHAALPAGGVGQVVYMSDGLATARDGDFAQALRRLGPVTELRADPQDLLLLLAPQPRPDRLVVRIGALPQPAPRGFVVRAEDAQGGVLAKVEGRIPAMAGEASVGLILPVELRNRIARLGLDGVAGTGGLRLLDEGDRRRPVGLIGGGGFSDTPLIGPLFYLERALSPDTELRTGDVNTLLSRQISVLIAPDGTLDDPTTRSRIAGWVRGGGMMVRFAGPRLASQQQETAPAADQEAEQGLDNASPPPGEGLLPTPLLGGSRTLGGAMSWSHPATLAAFAPDSPFAGLAVPDDVSVTRQVLAQPAADLDRHTWAKLSDGTPLVTHAALGAGQVVLFHVTATGDWSSLPFSGLFVQMLHRLVERSVGQFAQDGDGVGGDAMLAPFATFDGDGVLGTPPPSAVGVSARAIGHVAASAAHPPGLYGPRSDRRALNAGDGLPPLAASAPVGTLSDLAGRVPDRALGPWLLAAGLLLLAIDLLATLRLRGLLRLGTRNPSGRTAGAAVLLVLLGLGGGHASAGAVPAAAEETRLGYVVTGDAHTDLVSRQGLEGLSGYVNARTSAVLGHPDAVQPGHDDLSFYPLLYWPVTTGARPDPTAIAALNSYMSHGGILMIDTQAGAEPGNSSDPGSEADGSRALRQATRGLDIPPLAQVATSHVLAHSFYLLHSFPGRTVGAPVWVAAGADQGNDNVSPVIIGANDWAAAWATGDDGDTPYAVIPDGEAQRTTAYRFGVNAVIYALTGNYKADQVHVPALLQRLGE